MADTTNQIDRAAQQRETALRNVRQNAQEQATPECRENYFRSCEAHGGFMVEVVAQVRKELI